jgi:hypothetical protein
VKSGGSKACFVVLIIWNYILFLGNRRMVFVIKQLKIALGGHPAVLAKLNLLANKSIYWPSPALASESEQFDERIQRSE